MPLPVNTTLSLLGASRPGDALPSKPKKAMLVRMSSEILDALEASVQPQVQFEFGESPALYVGDASFPMIHSQETTMHELYLRSASATKKNAPLKLYANVIGKFAVEQREIGDELRGKIRESTQDAVAQRNRRATVLIDTPPEVPPVNKKRKDVPMFRKPLRQSDKVVKPTPSNPTSSTTTGKAHQPSSSQQGGVPVRKRLVHCLARGEKFEEELFRLLGADRNASLRAEVAGLLEQLAEYKTDKSGRLYKLNPVGWKEVRPFEWPGLSEQERIQLARHGRMTLRHLRIPESDPLWIHFQYKSPATAAFANSSTASADAHRPSTPNVLIDDKLRPGTTVPPKRGVSSRELKEKKLKPKGNPKAEVQMKDESQRVVKRLPADTPRRPQPSSSSSSTRQPKPPVGEPSSSLTTYPKASTSQIEKPNPQESKGLRAGDAHGSDSEKGRVRVKDKMVKKAQDNVIADSKPKLAKKRAVAVSAEDKSSRKSLDDYPDSKGSLKRKIRDEPEGANPKTQKRRIIDDNSHTNNQKPSKLRDDDEYTISKPRTSSKRKADIDDDYEPVRQKKPRADRESIPSMLSSSREDKQSAPPKKTATVSRVDGGTVPRGEPSTQSTPLLKIRKISPLPTKSNPPTMGREADRRSSSTVSGSIRKRRRSPIYTSTEDEKEDDSAQPSVKISAAAAARTATTASKVQKPQSDSLNPLPSNDNLRGRYRTTYLEYLSVIQKLLAQKGRLESLLEKTDVEGSGSVTDSEDELLPPEELEVLQAKYKRLHNELQAIKEAFDRRFKGTSLQ